MEGFDMDLGKIAGGALQEKANAALARVFENLSDPNTPYKDKRSMTIKLTFAQNEDRTDVVCQIQVDTKLAHPHPVNTHPVNTQFGMFTDLRDGSIQVEEYGSQVRGQTMLEDATDGKVVAMKKAN